MARNCNIYKRLCDHFPIENQMDLTLDQEKALQEMDLKNCTRVFWLPDE